MKKQNKIEFFVHNNECRKYKKMVAMVIIFRENVWGRKKI